MTSMGTVFLAFTPSSIGWLSATIAILVALLYAVRAPLKKRYHYVFIVFASVLIFWTVPTMFSQMTDDPTTAVARAWWGWFGAFARLPLLYTFVLFYTSHRIGKLWYTLIPVYLFAAIQTALFSIDDSFFRGQPRISQTGFSTGPGTLTPYLNPLGINIETMILSVPIFVLLARHYNLQQSTVVRSQVRYFIVGSFIFVGGRFSFFIAQVFSGPNLLPFLSAVGVVVMLLGLRKHGFFAVVPVSEPQLGAPLRYNLLQGFSYLAIEPEPKQSFEVFSNLALNEYDGLLITRSSPNSIRDTYGLKATPILWLTEEKSDNAIAPSDLHGLLVTIRAFLQKAERSVIMLHGLEYLVSVNGFKPVLRLIVRLDDLVVQNNGILIIPIVPGSLTEKQQTLLSAECTSLQKLEVSQSGEAITSPFQPRQELPPLIANAPMPAEAHVKEPLQFKSEDAEKAFRFLAKAFLQDYTVSRLLIDASGWRTSLEIAEGASLPARKMYGRDGGPGMVIAELLKRGLVETRWVTGQRGRGGTVMKVRINYANPYVKAEVDRLALQP